MAQQCGGQGAPIDSTAERFSQDTTPDLELIRERGFTEDYVNMFAGADGSCDAASPGNLVDQAPTFQAWSELRPRWVEVERSVDRRRSGGGLKEPLARCLEERSGLSVSVGLRQHSDTRSSGENWAWDGKAACDHSLGFTIEV